MKRKRSIKWNWRSCIPLSLLLLVVGILALNRGEGVINKLSYVVDPLYQYLLQQEVLTGYAMGYGGDTAGGSGPSDHAEDNGERDGNSQPGLNVNGNVQIVYGDGYMEEDLPDTGQTIMESNQEKLENLWIGKDYTYLIQNFYIVDSSTYVSEDLFPVEELLTMDHSFVKDPDNPQILIHHTHTSETFVDSREGMEEDTVVGMGTELASLLSEKYGYQVIHDKTTYDVIDGKLDRNRAYDNAKEGTLKILEEYPSIQVIIDLHRDSGTKRVTQINGKNTAQIMFFNGLSRNMNGPITYLYNPYLKENLSFSLQLKMKSMEYWDNYTKPIFLKGYEYNLSLLPKSLLIEVGTRENTVEEAINAMEPLAQMLEEVLNSES